MTIATSTRLEGRSSVKRYHAAQCGALKEIPEFLVGKDITGAWEYHPGSQQAWHTNFPRRHNSPTARCYLVYSETGDSGMRFILDGKVYTSYDKVGWCYRIFNVPQPHCVFANCHRVSYGFRLPVVAPDDQILDSKELPNAEAILHVT
jgi:hypothetical protein